MTLGEQGQHVPPAFRRLEHLTDFAVAFRYGAFSDLDEEFDRPTLTRTVERLVEHVDRLCRAATPPD